MYTTEKLDMVAGMSPQERVDCKRDYDRHLTACVHMGMDPADWETYEWEWIDCKRREKESPLTDVREEPRQDLNRRFLGTSVGSDS